MRILMITASLPYPPASGGAIRTYGLLHGLHDAGHDITLLSFHDRDLAPEDTPLAAICHRIETMPPPHRARQDRLHDLLMTSQPDIARRLYSGAFHKRLKVLLEEEDFDLVQFEGIEVACYLSHIRAVASRISLCYDAFNAEADLQRIIFRIDRQEPKRWPAATYSLIQAGRIERYERDLCRRADCVVAVSPEDAAILQRFRSDAQVFVVPNGIFAADYADSGEPAPLGEHAIVFTGKMDYRPNVDAMLWFAAEILPAVRAEIDTAHLTIVGQQPHPRLNALRGHPDITLTGWVDSVRPYLRAASVYVAPLRMGSGTRLKILEAMASGCAVVATSTAASGLLDEARRALVIADSAGDMANAVVRLLKDPSTRQKLGTAAREAVAQHYDWPVIIPRLLRAYEECGIG